MGYSAVRIISNVKKAFIGTNPQRKPRCTFEVGVRSVRQPPNTRPSAHFASVRKISPICIPCIRKVAFSHPNFSLMKVQVMANNSDTFNVVAFDLINQVDLFLDSPISKRLFFCGRRPLPFVGSHLKLPSGPAGIRTTTGSLSALARPTPYQLSHRVA